MSQGSQPADQPDWKMLLQVAEQLILQPNTAAQRDLILSTASQLVPGRAALWLAEPVHLLPGWEMDGKLFQPDPPTPLMAKAREQRQICLGVSDAVDASPSSKTQSAAFPLCVQDNLIGVLQMDRSGGPAFSPREIDLLNALTSHAALAIQVWRQSAIKNWRYEQLSLVRSVSNQIANVLDLDELTHRVTRSILDTFRFYYVAIFTLDPSSNQLQFRFSARSGEGAELSGHSPLGFEVKLGEGLLGYAAEQGQEIVAPDVSREPRYRFVPELPDTRSEVVLPLKIEDRILGVLDIQSDRLNGFHDMDLLVLRGLADNIALAIEGARLYSDLRRRADQIATVAEVSRAITSILDLDTLLNEVVALIHNRFGYPVVHLFTVHQVRGKIVYRAGSGVRSRQPQTVNLEYDLNDPLGIITWVARNGTSLLVNDVREEPRYRPGTSGLADIRAELAVPLIYAGEILGVLDAQSEQVGAFDENDRFLFEALADSIAIAIHNALTYRSEQWRRQVAESLRDVAGLLSSNAALDQVLDVILVELERNLPCEVSAIWLLEKPGLPGAPVSAHQLNLAAVRGCDRQAILDAQSTMDEVLQKMEEALNSDQPTIRLPNSGQGPLGAALNYPPDYSSIACPLLVGNQRVGIIAIAHPEAGRYGQEARSMTAAFASYAAVAIENTRLYANAQEQAWISTVLLQVAEATQTTASLDELLTTVVRLTPLLVGVEGCAVYLWDAEEETFEVNAVYEFNQDWMVPYSQEPIHLGRLPAFDQLYFGKQPVVIRTSGDPIRLPTSDVEKLEFHDIVLIPLLAHGEILGALLVEHHSSEGQLSPPSAFDDDQLAILQGIAQQTAVAVENLNLLEAKQEEAYVTAVLLQVAQAVVSSNELDDILSSIVNIMPVLVGMDCCLIYIWDAAQGLFRPAQVYDGRWRSEKQIMEKTFTPEMYPLLRAAQGEDRLIVCPLMDETIPPTEWHRLPLPDEDDSGVNRFNNVLVAAPLSVKGDVYGVMLARDSGAARRFRQRRIEILQGIAHQTALAIQNDRLQREMINRERLEREFQLARDIQRTFLPSELPCPRGWEVAARWQPAHQVGGDFYDVFNLPGKRLGLVIADVSDKGFPAALYMTVTRTLIRAAVLDSASPAQALRHVNKMLLLDSQNGMFITAIYAVLSQETGELVYANAGHNLPLVLRQGNPTPLWLEKGGMALGVIEEIELRDRSLRLNPGDCLVLYTDGVTEAFSPQGDMFGEERLIEVLRGMHGSSASELLEKIETAVQKFQGENSPYDDITLLAVNRKSLKSLPRKK